MKLTVIPIVVGALGTVLQRLGKETEETADQRQNWDHSDHSTAKLS